MTLFRLLTEGSRALEQAGVPDAGLDARQLLLAAFHIDMTHFLLSRMQELPEDDFHRGATMLYREMIAKRRRRMPLQQILGSQSFMGLEFFVNRHVLIPRQDTETLAELVLQEQCSVRGSGIGDGRMAGKEPNKESNREPNKEPNGEPNEEPKSGPKRRRLLDVCTGSGCIAVSLAVLGDFDQVTATDLSEEALKVARRNASALLEKAKEQRAGRDDVQIEFYQGDLFQALPQDGRKYDVITSNPPYIPTSVIAGLEPEVREHEPMLALDGSPDGLAYYRRIAAEAGEYLAEGGSIYLEIGYDQGDAVSGLMRDAGFREVRVCKDLAGKDRVVCAGHYAGKNQEE